VELVGERDGVSQHLLLLVFADLVKGDLVMVN